MSKDSFSCCRDLRVADKTHRYFSLPAAAMRYAVEGVPLVVVASREYGTGSSRD